MKQPQPEITLKLQKLPILWLLSLTLSVRFMPHMHLIAVLMAHGPCSWAQLKQVRTRRCTGGTTRAPLYGLTNAEKKTFRLPEIDKLVK